jgi:hypothetical protein
MSVFVMATAVLVGVTLLVRLNAKGLGQMVEFLFSA